MGIISGPNYLNFIFKNTSQEKVDSAKLAEQQHQVLSSEVLENINGR